MKWIESNDVNLESERRAWLEMEMEMHCIQHMFAYSIVTLNQSYLFPLKE